MHTRRNYQGFSLIELVIVVVIIGIIAAIAIPRISRGSEGALDSALRGNLAVLRNAVDLFATEHSGRFPSASNFENALIQFTDNATTITAQATQDSTHIFGPYVRSIPNLPVGTNKGNNTVADAAGGGALGQAGDGWYYDENTGAIQANLVITELDVTGTPYANF